MEPDFSSYKEKLRSRKWKLGKRDFLDWFVFSWIFVLPFMEFMDLKEGLLYSAGAGAALVLIRFFWRSRQ